MRGVIPIRDRPSATVVRRDLSEDVVEIITSVYAGLEEALVEMGLRICSSCGEWCEPVAIDPELHCSRCEVNEMAEEIEAGIGASKEPKELARSLYLRTVPDSDPPPRIAS